MDANEDKQLLIDSMKKLAAYSLFKVATSVTTPSANWTYSSHSLPPTYKRSSLTCRTNIKVKLHESSSQEDISDAAVPYDLSQPRSQEKADKDA